MADRFSCVHEAQLREQGWEPIFKLIVLNQSEDENRLEVHYHASDDVDLDTLCLTAAFHLISRVLGERLLPEPGSEEARLKEIEKEARVMLNGPTLADAVKSRERLRGLLEERCDGV